MCDLIGDVDEVYVSKWQKAPAARSCHACVVEIRAGERFHYVAQLEDRRRTYSHCPRCWFIIQALWAAGAEWVQYDLKCGEYWEDNFDELPPHVAELAFLTPAEAQARVAEKL